VKLEAGNGGRCAAAEGAYFGLPGDAHGGLRSEHRPVHDVGETVNAKSSALTFDTMIQRYTYLWKIERSWVGSCRELVFRLNDGQERLVRFRIAR
jgi:hypothetical protein